MFTRKRNRLPAEAYRSGSFSLTICTAERRPHLCDSETVSALHALLFREAAHPRIRIDVCCFMPDPFKLLVTRRRTDVQLSVKRFKQASAVWFCRSTRAALWQKGYYDRCVRNDEVLERVADYILDNPVRKGWWQDWSDYPFSWSRWHAAEP